MCRPPRRDTHSQGVRLESSATCTNVPRSVSKLLFKLVQRLIKLILRDQIATIVAHLHHCLSDSPQIVSLDFIIHLCCLLYSK